MDSNIIQKGGFKQKYAKNPAWYWLLFSLFSFFLLPEYISPFILFVAFIIFKRQWTKEGRFAKVGTLGKIELVLMCYMLLSVLWSPTKLDTLGCAGLWWAVFLIQVMIYNLARTKAKIKRVIEVIVASAAINGVVALFQMVGFLLYANGLIPYWLAVPTPFYRDLDTLVYSAMPFKIGTKMWMERASGFFSNPNLLATLMLFAFPLAIYLFINAKNKRESRRAFFGIVALCAGVAASQSRAGCFIMMFTWIALFIIQIKRHSKKLLEVFVPTGLSIVPAMLTRYGIISLIKHDTIETTIANVDGEEAIKSSIAHFQIWGSMIDYLTHHFWAFVFGTGFGMQRTGEILAEVYGLKKPHSHNFVIELWAELGIVGIAIFIAIIICAFGKLLEINSNNSKSITLVFAVFASTISFLLFGLSDYIFNSPKQIILLMIILGITQAMSYVYEKTEIHSPNDLVHVAERDWYNIIHQ
ncbi:MAG: O-antigen ligase family protein [Ruminococcaceae bacterium]|nr:O-antigen ligase family protein [Oscillospiraceae bacterium]